MDKVVSSASAALEDVRDGASLAVGGFGLCGIPSVLIAELHAKGGSTKYMCVICTFGLRNQCDGWDN